MPSRPQPYPLDRLAALGVFWGTIERFATQGVSFLVVLVLARLLGPEEYGLVALASTIVLFGQMLIGETFAQALILHKDLKPEHGQSLFWLLLAAGIVGALAIVAAAPSLAAIFREPQLAEVVRALSPLLIFTGLQSVPSALFRRNLDFRSLAAASALGTIAGGGLGIGLAFAGAGIWSLVASLLVQNALTAFTTFARSPFRPAWLFSREALRELWQLGQFSFLLRISAFAANQAPRILVGYLFGTAALGAFSLGLRLVEMLSQLLVVPVANVTTSLVSRVRDDASGLERAIMSVTQFGAMVAVPAFVTIAAAAPAVVPAIFGAKWADSVTIVRLVSVFGIAASFGLIWNAIVTGLGRPDITLATSVSAAIVNLTVLLLLSPLGVTVSAAAFAVRGCLTIPFVPIVIARLTGIPVARLFKVHGPVVLAALGMAISIELTLETLSGVAAPVLLSAISLAAGGAVYLAVLYSFARPQIRQGMAFALSLKPAKGIT